MHDDTTRCAELVERGDPDRFLATMAAPGAARARLFPLYAFNLEVARAPWVTQEPMIAAMRLQFWTDTLEEIGAGAPSRPHEVAGPLATVLRGASAPLPELLVPLQALVAARHWDIDGAPFADAAAFRAHLDATGAGLMWVAARLLGAPGSCEEMVRAAGRASALANWLMAVPALEAAGRVPLVDGRPEAVAALAREGLAELALARRDRAWLPAAARPALLPGWRAQGILRMAARAPGGVGRGDLRQSEFVRRGSLLLRALSGRW